MITGIGIDLVEISRIAEMLARWEKRFISKVFTEEEIALCDGRTHRAASYAARFAAKEACAKALGTGWNELFSWKDFSIRTAPDGRPLPILSARLQSRLGQTKVHLSLSHTENYATAMVILESD
ncbi:MAG: holo-ACP synthase [bacterium]